MKSKESEVCTGKSEASADYDEFCKTVSGRRKCRRHLAGGFTEKNLQAYTVN